MRNLWIIIGVIVLIAIIGGFLLLNSRNSGTTTKTNPTTQLTKKNAEIPETNAGTAKTYTIDISNFAFNSATLRVNAGDTVTWTNTDAVGHTVTSDSGSELDSALLGKGESYSHKFNTVGSYNYHCKPHPYMKGNIIVE